MLEPRIILLLFLAVRYFYNLKRCSQFSVGPKCFAVIGECDNSYYFSDSSKTWKKYISGQDFKCSC